MKSKVLAIDDEQIALDALEALLSMNGIDVAVALTAAEGLERCDSFSPDVLLLDWNLAETTGIDVLTTLRETRKHSDLFVIMLSGKIMTDNIVTAIAAGADDYVIKPYSADELIARVNNGIRINRRRRSETERTGTLLESVRRIDALCSQLTGIASEDQQTRTLIAELKAAAIEMKRILGGNP
jgi:DNA-binding response OmpR family regulator